MNKNSDVIQETCELLGGQERLARSRNDWDATEAVFEALSEIIRLYPERREELFAAYDRGNGSTKKTHDCSSKSTKGE
jgi:hypothetical protein